MAHIKRKTRNETSAKNASALVNQRSFLSRPSDDSIFFQWEPAVVVDVILDDKHPYIKKTKLNSLEYPPDLNNKKHEIETNLSYVGRVLVRMQHSNKRAKRESLSWAIPLEQGISEFPLINEVVSVVEYFGELFYTRRLNLDNRLNSSADFRKELLLGDGFSDGINSIRESDEEANPDTAYQGPISTVCPDENKLDGQPNPKFNGVLGRYFKFNKKIRKLQRFEGDTVLESRFGQSIRFGSYVNDKSVDNGDPKNSDYSDQGGNPMILIRNRQRSANKKPTDVNGKDVPPNLRADAPLNSEIPLDGTMLEDVNWDGSSIQITSGLTESKFKRELHFKKAGFEKNVKEEQPLFNVKGSTNFTYPKLIGDQIVINTGRLIFSSRDEETLHFSKKRYQIITDSEYTVDAHQQIVMTTNEKVVFNAPHIFLGQYDETKEPAMLGQSTMDWMHLMCKWLDRVCDWLEVHEHDNKHLHPTPKGTSGAPDPSWTQAPRPLQHIKSMKLLRKELEELRQLLPTLCSKRVFLTGGGYAPGLDGQSVVGLVNDKVGTLTNTPGGLFIPSPGSYTGTILDATSSEQNV